MSDDKRSSLAMRLFSACFLLLLSVVALWVALELLARFWGWLLLFVVVIGVIATIVWYLRWRRDRGW